MNVKKYVFTGIGVFILVVLLAIGISAKFTFSNITSNPYMFIENFFSQWSPALSAAGALIVALLAVWAIYESRRSQERERERAIYALHGEMHWNISDVITLRFQISELSKKLDKAIGDLEASFKFLPRYLKETDKSQQAKPEQEGQRGTKLKHLNRDKYFVLPFVIIVSINVGVLIAIAFLHPLDSEFTLAIRWSYVCYGLAGAIGLLAALLGTQSKWVGRALIIAIELFVGGMLLQLLSLI